MLNEKERSDLTKITLLIAKGIGKSLDSFREEVLKKEHPELEPYMSDRNFRCNKIVMRAMVSRLASCHGVEE